MYFSDGDNDDVWVSELARGTLSRLTTDAAFDGAPLWTPDGSRVVFASQRGGSLGLYSASADGTGDAALLMAFDDEQVVLPYAWSDDGTTLVFQYQAAETGRDIGVLALSGEPTWEPLLDTMAEEFSPALSPDGAWIAYTSDETGQLEVCAQRFPELGGKVSISVGPGRHPVWAPDGRSLYFSAPDGIRAVPVEPAESLRADSGEILFDDRTHYGRATLRDWDLSPDGRQFLMLKSGGAGTDPGGNEAVLVKNWLDELSRLVPDP